uniref:Uncharacterized protein n=1 Tax=Globodera rostochiensis TaxID=31243 RepID=A0A914HWF4_GLORO
MTETNSAQIAAEQASSSASLNNAVRELQVIRARILELEDQQQTTNSTTRNMGGSWEQDPHYFKGRVQLLDIFTAAGATAQRPIEMRKLPHEEQEYQTRVGQ